MTLFEFRLLELPDQVALLYSEGVYIGKRKEGKTIILLYQLEAFYIEVYYRTYRRHVKTLYCTASTSILDAYLEQIDVEQLVG